MLKKSAAERALGKAISTGGDFAEIFYEDTRRSRLSETDSTLDTATTGRIQDLTAHPPHQCGNRN